ncbi:MAG: Crp/Fnr family transcriptional regulator [Acidobacteria bacterium]|nr:Crp/Fnr family transcriptional regulator [Acidobacteriota bacterium]
MNETTVDSRSSDEILSLFRQRGRLIDCPPGIELFRQGHAIHDVCLLERGLIKLTHANKDGNEFVIDLRLPGRMLGAATVISRNLALVTGMTLTDCRIHSLSAEAFLNVVETDIEFSQHVLRVISQQFYEQVVNLAELGSIPARSRLARILLKFIPEPAYKLGEEIRLQLPVSKADLAGLLAIAPSYFSRLLGKLEEKGVIRRSKGWIYVRSIDLLRQEAE